MGPADPEAQRLAEESETAQLMHQHYLASAFEAGEAKGKAEGLRQAVRSMCDLLDIELVEAKERQLSSLELEQLTRLIQKLKTERQWPQDL